MNQSTFKRAAAFAALFGSTLATQGALAAEQMKAPFRAIRLGSPSGQFEFNSHRGTIDSGTGDFESPFEVNNLEAFVKAHYLREDLRIVLAYQSLMQIERGTALSESTKAALAPLAAAWKAYACQTLLSIEKNGLASAPVGALCKDVDATKVQVIAEGRRAIYALNPLAAPGPRISKQEMDSVLAALASPTLEPARDAWAKAYASLFETVYWEFFDTAAKDWTWKMIMQEEAARHKLNSPVDQALVRRYNDVLASTRAATISMTDAAMLSGFASLSPDFVRHAHYAMLPFERDARVVAHNLQTLKQTQVYEKMRAEYSQAVVAYLVQKHEGSLSMPPRELRALNERATSVFASKNYLELKSQLASDALLAKLVSPGQLAYRKVQVVLDTTKSKAAIFEILKSKMNDGWLASVQKDIDLAVKASTLGEDYINDRLTENYMKALKSGFLPALQNQILLYELALEVKSGAVSGSGAAQSWNQAFVAGVATKDLSGGAKLEEEINAVFGEIAKLGNSDLANKALRNFVEFRALETLDRAMLEEETRFVGRWKEKEVSGDSLLVNSIDSIQSRFADLQKGPGLKFIVRLNDAEESAVFGSDPFVEGLATKLFETQDWKSGGAQNNRVAIHFDKNLKEGVHVFVVDHVSPSKVVSAFDVQSEVRDIYESRAYLDAFRRLRERVIKDYTVEMTLRSGKLLTADGAAANHLLGK